MKVKISMDNILWLVVVLVLVFYILYSKGIIMANFESVSVKAAQHMIKKDKNVTVLDVRTAEEVRDDGKIAKAKHIPLNELSQNLSSLNKSKKVLVYCRSGSRSVSASRMLEKNGFTPLNLSGGINAWKAEKLPVK
ncbi:MAG: Rhodanese-like domain protein [uncultured Sulfurovum sp.]|uniref:Rhodanese-like domain protein n=1 Tax=uncultured Sulfurovum sp. TaxID=269237 RepID=A0A6S6SEE4_9BACT|nr:MAG: Rhodanese-like domain protein [uncultured Sulfurovum sp.]